MQSKVKPFVFSTHLKRRLFGETWEDILDMQWPVSLIGGCFDRSLAISFVFPKTYYNLDYEILKNAIPKINDTIFIDE